MYGSYGVTIYNEARRLASLGVSDYEVGRRLGVPRSTVQSWRKRTKPRRRDAGTPTAPSEHVPPNEERYAYLLGAYLGDGWLWQTGPASWRLHIYCDAAYPRLIEEVAAAVAACSPQSRIRRNAKGREAAIVVLASSSLWGAAFPQHGPGRKHERKIELEPWQRDITHRHPKALLRGLIHSDGSRCVNRFRTTLPSGRVAEYAYPRYFFTNYSEDIRRIFCEHCELIGVRWTQSNPRNISVSHRDSVAILDSFIGPKR